MSIEDVDWALLLQVHDRFQSEVTVQFLEDHGIEVQTSGGANWALPTISMTDVRLLVARADLERARQVLAAMRAENAGVHPFRDAPPEAYEAPVSRRKGAFAAILALLVPVGGGHFYARHTAAGAILAAGIVGGLLGARFGMPFLVLGSGLLVLGDAASSPFAVRRANADEIPSDRAQRLWALVCVVGAYVVARLLA